MTSPHDVPLQKIQFYVTSPYSCGYLAKQRAQSLIATPQHLIDSNIYSSLIAQGFRRSGQYVYRPYCEECDACIPVRIPVDHFKPNRSQSRAWKKHQNLSVSMQALHFDDIHFELYLRYQAARHEGDGEQESAEQYKQFLVQSNVESYLLQFELDGVCKMVCVVDRVQDGLSAVYTFYDPDEQHASYGTYAILWLIDWCKREQLPFLYLGYWISGSPKMVYKQNFRPLQALIDRQWQDFDASLASASTI